MRFAETTLEALSGGPQTLVLCQRARQAQAMREAHNRIQAARGAARWQPLEGAAYAQWLDRLCTDALLDGDLPPAALPGGFLTRLQEEILWRRAIGEDLGTAEGELFDIDALARTAQQADLLCAQWQIRPDAGGGAEVAAFLRWRGRVQRLARDAGLLTAGEALAWRLDCVERGLGRLPQTLVVLDAVPAEPCWQRLLRQCEARGTQLARMPWPGREAARSAVAATADEVDEACCAARWAAHWLQARPESRLRIAVAGLRARQAQFAAALDAALHPQLRGVAAANVERRWVCEQQPLDQHFLVVIALRLLTATASGPQLEFAQFAALVRGPGWGGDRDEAEVRARFEVALRERLPPHCSLTDWSRLASAEFSDWPMPRTRMALAALAGFARSGPTRRKPGAWADAFERLLAEAGWPGQRAESHSEASARLGFFVALRSLAALDSVAGAVDQSAALRMLRQVVGEARVRAPRQTAAAVELVDLDDALGGPVDGIWIAGLSAAVWPPMASPNPLLPAAAQRGAGVTAASVALLAADASRQQQAWARHADEVRFSWPRQAQGRSQLASPLLAGLPSADAVAKVLPPPPGIACELSDDRWAPAPDPGELARLAGGSALLAAQARCPAWAFFRYRLGAMALRSPVTGLDAAARGELIHSALEALWNGRDQAWLLGLDPLGVDAALTSAVERALTRFAERRPGRIGARTRLLERERLRALLGAWLELERQRPPFTVVECEGDHLIDLVGLRLRVIVDRIDRLDDGRYVLLDYKSGRQASSKLWADVRPGEPQLPLYAIGAAPGELAAVALARVAVDRLGFDGVAAEPGVLPKVADLATQRTRYAEADFADWSGLRATWRARLEALADEFLRGDAAVCAAESDLAYCEVKPLLRLAERRAQHEVEAGR